MTAKAGHMEQPRPVDDPLYDLDGARNYLGGIARATLYSWASRGVIARTKVGSRLMFRESELRRVIRDEAR